VRVEAAETPEEIEIPKMKPQKASDARAKEDQRRKEEKKQEVAEESRKAPKKEVKKEQKEEIKTAAGSEANEELQPEESGNVVITSDEIEKRAAAAAAKAKSEGRPEIPVHVEKREGGKRDRGHGHDRSRRRDDLKEAEAVRRHEPSRPKPERVIKPIPEEQAEELKNTAVAFLKSVFDAMKIDAEIEAEYTQEDGTVNCVFSGEEMGIIIGKRGQTLDSLQYLLSLVINKDVDGYIHVKADTENYRE
jgi:spoIIIJ-associated protein